MREATESSAKTTPLSQPQRELGASFGQLHGWEMAESFVEPLEEYRRVRSAVGLFDLSFCGAIRVAGKEAVQFLSGLVTNDVKSLERGKGMRAAFLTGHGKVMALCRVLGLGDEFLIINDPQTHNEIFKYVFPFSYAGDFKVSDVTGECRVLSVQGPKSLLVMREVCFEPVPLLNEHDWIETIIGGQHVLVVRASHTGELGYDILIPDSGLKDVWDFILMKGGFHSIAPVGFRALDWLRIEAGIPIYGVDVDETNMMLETGLLDAVSYTKGCYTGQEAVAMATYRGHVSKRLSGLLVADGAVPRHGDPVQKEGKEIGHVTSSLASPTLSAVIAMGYLKYGFFEAGSSAEIISDGLALQATVVELPFYRATS